MSEPSWASHPNVALRVRLAEYLGMGYTIRSVEEHSAVVARPKPFVRTAWGSRNPFSLLSSARRRDDEVLITILDDGRLHETRI